MISIHALLAESDNFLLDLHLGGYKISIHALLAESDNTGQPVRGLPSYFYPRSPCGERPWGCRWHSLRNNISIHALLAESDQSFLQ